MIDNFAEMAEKLQHRVEEELEQNEQINWSAQPLPKFFTKHSIGAFVFAIPWTAISLVMLLAAFSDDGGVIAALFLIPFLLIGFGMLSTPLWVYRFAQLTIYLITDRRAITFNGGWSTTIRSYPPDKLQDVYRKEHSNGTGDVIIQHRAWRDSDGESQSEELGFLRIQNAKEVEALLKALAKDADSGL